MGRRKSNRPTELLTCHVQAKVTEEVYKRLDQVKSISDCQTIGELARRILSKEKITTYHRDVSLDAPLEELVKIRKEINAIGVNINQITHQFHLTDDPKQRVFQALKIADEYKKVGARIDRLMTMISYLGRKWLQR